MIFPTLRDFSDTFFYLVLSTFSKQTVILSWNLCSKKQTSNSSLTSISFCAASRMIAGWIPDEVMAASWPRVYLAFNRCEYQGYFFGCKCSKDVVLTSLLLLIQWKSGPNSRLLASYPHASEEVNGHPTSTVITFNQHDEISYVHAN